MKTLLFHCYFWKLDCSIGQIRSADKDNHSQILIYWAQLASEDICLFLELIILFYQMTTPKNKKKYKSANPKEVR